MARPAIIMNLFSRFRDLLSDKRSVDAGIAIRQHRIDFGKILAFV
jgi:hypothetical protein